MRTEGINNYSEGINNYSESSETISSVSSKHRKRHRHKKNKNKRSDKDFNFDSNEINHEEIQQMSSTKRVKLLFGDNKMKMKILNIPNVHLENSAKKIPTFF